MESTFLKQNKSIVFLAIIAACVVLFFGYKYVQNKIEIKSQGTQAAVLQQDPQSVSDDPFARANRTNPVVTLKTSMGDIAIELYMDKTPTTAGNFLELSESGFYTDTKFHRVIDNFMIQGGDPNSKGDDVEIYGRGGPGYTIEDEFVSGLSNLRGTISMANIGQPNTGGSQFFINYTNNIGLDFDKEPLTSKHSVFGTVVVGMDVVDAIIHVETDSRDLPLEPVVIEDIVISPGEVVELPVEAVEEESEDVSVEEAVLEGETEEVTEDGTDEALEIDTEEPEAFYTYPNFDLGAIPLFSTWGATK